MATPTQTSSSKLPPGGDMSSIQQHGEDKHNKNDENDEIFTFLLIFQRWATTLRDGRDCILPSGFVLDLKEYLIKKTFHIPFNDDRTFHLRTIGRPESSRYNAIYEFSTATTKDNDKNLKKNDSDDDDDDTVNNNTDKDILHIRCVRKSDNDVHKIDIKTRQVTSAICHWMSGTREVTSQWEPIESGVDDDDDDEDDDSDDADEDDDQKEIPKTINKNKQQKLSVKNAETSEEILFDCWLNPNKWIEENDYFIVHPGDVEHIIDRFKKQESTGEDGDEQDEDGDDDDDDDDNDKNDEKQDNNGNDETATNDKTTTTKKKHKNKIKYGKLLCPSAKQALVDGYNLLLFTGNKMVRIPLGVRNERLTIAGMMWKYDGNDTDTDHMNNKKYHNRIRKNNNNNNATYPTIETKNLSFIIAEGAPYSRSSRRFQNDMFQWEKYHIYKYHSGRWR